MGKLLAVAKAREAELEAHRSTLDQQRSSSSQAAAEAEAEARAEHKRGEEARGELWQRLKRQAVMQAAEARELQQSLSLNRGEAEAARQAAAQEAHHLRHALSQSDVRLVEVSNHLRSAEEAHVRQLVLTGVIATKHGRKGKPHPRHVRVSQSLRRLEWGKPAALVGRGGGDDEKRSVDVGEISEIVPGVATEVARRSGKGKEALFLSVISPARTLDLEFASAELRDTWLRALRHWRGVRPHGTGHMGLLLGHMGLQPGYTGLQPGNVWLHPSSYRAAASLTHGCRPRAQRAHGRARVHRLRCLRRLRRVRCLRLLRRLLSRASQAAANARFLHSCRLP